MPALGMTWQTQTCDTARGSEWKHILIMSLSSWRDPSDIEISSLFVEAKKCPLSEEFCFGRQAQVLGQNLIPSGISRLSIQTDFISLVTTQAFEPSTWMFPGQAYSGISCPAGLLVASVASFPKSRLCLAVNRCFSLSLKIFVPYLHCSRSRELLLITGAEFFARQLVFSSTLPAGFMAKNVFDGE